MKTDDFKNDLKKRKLCSIIVLNFNGQDIIDKCLKHLLNQTYHNFEIIIVDNNSSDDSLAILERYLPSQKISIIRSKKNLGVPGGRNLGGRYAGGEIIAFMDNDGYARPTWLEQAMETIESSETIGAVASLVFFNKKKTVLNGAGGTLNLQGYGGDICFNLPYEFARLPKEVLYPMGCGMVVKREVLERIGPLDSHLFNYYDDVELGIRIWKLGFSVVLAPDAQIDHDFSVSEEVNKNKVSLCERNRIRTLFKYRPSKELPEWFLRELLHLYQQNLDKGIILKAWAWNFIHLGSALKWRTKFASSEGSFKEMLDQSWGFFPPPSPKNYVFQPTLERAKSELIIDGVEDRYQLNYGWYDPEVNSDFCYRWTDTQASAYFFAASPTEKCSINFCTLRREPFSFVIWVRRAGETDPLVKIPIETSDHSWQEIVRECRIDTGFFELLIISQSVQQDRSGRSLGMAVASIKLN